VWTVVAWAVVWIGAWLLVWRRRGRKWPLFVGLLPAALLLGWLLLQTYLALAALFVPAIVLLIGLGKFIVWAAGRRGVLARSGLKAGRTSVSPEGLVK